MTRHNSVSDIDERQDKEPELADSRLAILGFLNEALLVKDDEASQWSIKLSAIPDEQLGRLNIDAFPDVQPHKDKTGVYLLVLVLTQCSEQLNNDGKFRWTLRLKGSGTRAKAPCFNVPIKQKAVTRGSGRQYSAHEFRVLASATYISASPACLWKRTRS